MAVRSKFRVPVGVWGQGPDYQNSVGVEFRVRIKVRVTKSRVRVRIKVHSGGKT